MQELHTVLKDILEKGYLLSLGTVDAKGVWVADVIYVFDHHFNLYWLSQPSTRHSQAIFLNPSVAGTITLTLKPGEPDIGLQIEGVAEKIEGDILEMAIKHRLKRGKHAPTKEGEIFEPGQSWYKLIPKKIEIIYEPKYKKNKQIIFFNDDN